MPHTSPLATDTRFIEATNLSAEIRSVVTMHDGPKVPTYGSLKTAMYSGKIPSEKVGGKLVVRASDLPMIVRAFGLSVVEHASDAVAA